MSSGSDECSLIELCKFHCRVSSTLNRATKQFGPRLMFDGKEDTCWNSDQGQPQYILLKFSKLVRPRAVHLQFQGGFVGRAAFLEACDSARGNLAPLQDLAPDPRDDCSVQVFPVTPECPPVDCLKIVFQESTDLYGRVTLYKLDVRGVEAS